MKTKLLRVDPARPDPAALREAGEVLRRGGLVAFPTETVYGLGANALDPAAVARIFAVKGRPGDNPLIVHVADRESLGDLVTGIPPVGRDLMAEFWPGPLTLVLPKAERVPDEVTAGLPTVAVRMPDHDVALGLIAAAGVPVAAPSANRSGRPSPTTAEHVREDLDGRVELILDGGPAGVGVESTVIDVTGPVPALLRPGGIALEDIRRVAGQVEVDPALLGNAVERPRAPGMKYVHYAPRAPLTLVAPRPGSGPAEVGRAAWAAVRERLATEPGTLIGLLALEDNLPAHWKSALDDGLRLEVAEAGGGQLAFGSGILAIVAGPAAAPEQVAVRLYAALRRFDRAGVSAIVAEGVAGERLGFSVMNRLRKAATAVIEV